jgi:hypothetical protein
MCDTGFGPPRADAAALGKMVASRAATRAIHDVVTLIDGADPGDREEIAAGLILDADHAAHSA